ncbi:hypothetical protein SAMN05660462_00991 [Proteiniborus ethanoligenes]|uniref:Uncharacterized protein n=1 Tax=Proteiniborus ethanoligenes TaxID=415015 RepID=A0A1H3N026_9FIRM|nr:hypothetical protein [Proteiniborus ethanoligenes]SDY82196.1 hypothetical protein SAMN05660462_00991 [Proteiniborus ethanoligenes]
MANLSIHSSPRYVKITVDIVHRIYKGELKEGLKLRDEKAKIEKVLTEKII